MPTLTLTPATSGSLTATIESLYLLPGAGTFPGRPIYPGNGNYGWFQLSAATAGTLPLAAA